MNGGSSSFPSARRATCFENGQLAARGFFQEVEHPALDAAMTYPGAFCAFSETPLSIRRPAPLPGEHNVEVYEELGLSRDQIVTLAEAGVV